MSMVQTVMVERTAHCTRNKYSRTTFLSISMDELLIFIHIHVTFAQMSLGGP